MATSIVLVLQLCGLHQSLKTMPEYIYAIRYFNELDFGYVVYSTAAHMNDMNYYHHRRYHTQWYQYSAQQVQHKS